MHKKYDMVILGAGINGVAIAKVLHIYGGKLTTFPSSAQKVLDVLK